MGLTYKSESFDTDVEAVTFLNALHEREETEKYKAEKYNWFNYPFSYEIKSIYAVKDRVYVIWEEVIN